MSIRAYRVITQKLAKTPTFNLWHDNKILNFIEKEDGISVDSNLNENGSGQFDVTVKTLKKLLKQKNLNLSPEQEQTIQTDIDFAIKNKTEYVLYDSY